MTFSIANWFCIGLAGMVGFYLVLSFLWGD
jgi:hypothetical protein